MAYKAPDPAKIRALKQSFLTCMLIGFGLQFIVYGIYVCLFVVSLTIMYRRRRGSETTVMSKVFLVATSTIFLISTFGVAVNLYRIVKGFLFSPDAWWYFMQATHWEHFADNMNLTVALLIGDALVIYRAFIVWNRSWLAISLPLLILFAQIGLAFAIFIGYRDPKTMSFWSYARLLLVVYPLAFAQNVMTTGLISYRILRQHQLSKAAGIQNVGSSLFYISRIIVESAVVYTLQSLVLIVLLSIGSNAIWIVRFMTVPTMGIVFSLLAVRVHLSQMSKKQQPPPETRSRALPTFAHWTSTPLSLTETFDTNVATCTNPETGSAPYHVHPTMSASVADP